MVRKRLRTWCRGRRGEGNPAKPALHDLCALCLDGVQIAFSLPSPEHVFVPLALAYERPAVPAEDSRSYELGAKLDTPGGLAGTLAVYRIQKKNVLTTNPVNTDYAIPAGEVASKGVELDLSGRLRRGLKLSASYAYTDARVTRGDNTIRTGSRFPNVPRHGASLLLVAGDARASAGAGLAYVGERFGDVAASSDFRLPGYTTARLVTVYAPDKRWRIALNVDNLFNRRYYASSYSQLWVAPGSTRTAMATLSYRY